MVRLFCMGESIVRASVWTALLCYSAGPLGAAVPSDRGQRVLRVVWTLGAAAFLVHVVSSFHVFYDWSHTVAVAETARQVYELTGFEFGTGLYLNYVFTLIWVVDSAWWWRNATGYRRRSWRGVLFTHGFFLFMIFNATVIFEDGFVRILGLLVTLVGTLALVQASRQRRARR